MGSQIAYSELVLSAQRAAAVIADRRLLKQRPRKQESSTLSRAKQIYFRHPALNPSGSHLLPYKGKIMPPENFFVPLAESAEQAERVLESCITFAEENLGWKIGKNVRYFSIAWQHDGSKYYAEVGKPEPYSGEIVIAILPSTTNLIFTENRGVARGEPILIGTSEVLGTIPFLDYCEP